MVSDATLIWALGIAGAILATAPALRRLREEEADSTEANRVAEQLGLSEPSSLHPVIDSELCIGIGNCMRACPEDRVLGMRNGQAFVAMPGRCIGHGACEASCPVSAIRLVFGTRERGVDLPRLSDDFETNVPGLYVVGELGGMGLIKNAFEQGRQCIESIAALRDGRVKGLDLVIVGAGPAGLSATLTAHRVGLRAVTLEREDIGGAVRHYPRKKLVMSEPVVVPGFGKIRGGQTKDELVEMWTRTLADEGLTVHTGETVTSVSQQPDGRFLVRSDHDTYRAARVVLAIGRGVPRKLEVPGESLPKVHYFLREPGVFRGDKVLIVGGGDSAVEAALELADQPGASVTLSHRRDRLTGVTSDNGGRLENAIGGGQIRALPATRVESIHPYHVELVNEDTGLIRLPNDHVFIFAGGEMPTDFLRACGVDVVTKYGEV